MEKINESIASWPSLSNGIHYNWLVDYPAYSAFGTYELSNEDWEKRDFIQNFKGNSELTTETDHQQAMSKAISLVSDYVIEHFGEEAKQLCLLCVPASLQSATKRRFEHFSNQVCQLTGMENLYPAISFTSEVDEVGDTVDTSHLDAHLLQGKRILIFDDIIASGGSLALFADKLSELQGEVVAALALGKKISDGYDQ